MKASHIVPRSVKLLKNSTEQDQDANMVDALHLARFILLLTAIFLSILWLKSARNRTKNQKPPLVDAFMVWPLHFETLVNESSSRQGCQNFAIATLTEDIFLSCFSLYLMIFSQTLNQPVPRF